VSKSSEEKERERNKTPYPGRYIAYLPRDATKRHRKMIRDFLKGQDVVVYREITDLDTALTEIKLYRAALLVATLDVLPPRVSVIANMIQHMKIEVCDMPNASDFVLRVKAALLEEARDLRNARAEKRLKSSRFSA
jgi:F420-0:gamma-glutamyl ligase-like protein